MTDGEIKTMQHMWELGMTIEAIARRMMYSYTWTREVIMRNRDKFPYRSEHHDIKLKRMVAKNVMAGNMSRKMASKKFGIHINTVDRWCRQMRRGELDDQADLA